MNDKMQKSTSFNIARHLTAGILGIVAMQFIMILHKTPAPIPVVTIIAISISCSVGLYRNLSWAYWPSVIFILLVAYLISGSMIFPTEGGPEPLLQRLTEHVTVQLQWVIFMSIWLFFLGLIYCMNYYRNLFRREWW